VLDDVPGNGLDQNRVYNLDGSVYYWVFDAAVNQPPDAPGILIKDDYAAGFECACGVAAVENILNAAPMPDSGDVCVMLDRRVSNRTDQADLDAYAVSHPESHQQPGVILLAGFGMNGDEGGSGSYLLDGGPEGGSLFNAVNGAVFTSIESFNAVTMFTNVGPNQGKIVDFITIGGSGAIGHAFEPIVDAIVDNEFLMYNLLADLDGDFIADLTFVEAAFTAIPYLSWTEVVIGDPLMQIYYNDQTDGTAWVQSDGDVNFDGKINVRDLRVLKRAMGGNLNSSNPAIFGLYNDLCDLNGDGKIDVRDIRVLKRNM